MASQVGGRARGLWHAWLDTLPPLDNCTYFWSSAEIDELEEERAIKRTHARRQQIHSEYETLVRVLLEGGLEDDLPNGVEITVDDYAWALHVVTRHALHLAYDFPILLPMSFRFHPMSACELYEYGEQSDPNVALYVAPEGARAGAEFTMPSEDGPFNTDLVVNAGYVWDDLAATRPSLRLSEGTRELSSPLEQARRRLRDGANWTSPMDFDLSSEELNAEMLAWLRLSFATPAELEAVAAPREDCLVPLSPFGRTTTEEQVARALVATIEQNLARFDHSVEEDEEILGHSRRTGRRLSARAEIAVTYRKLCKQVLHRTRAMVEEHFKAYQQGRLPLGMHRPAAGVGAARTSVQMEGDPEAVKVTKSKKKKKKKKKQKATEQKDEL